MIDVPPPLLPGDYNDDDSVDAADYTVWRDSVASTISLPNETASMGVVDAEDYDAWKANFGTVAEGGSAAVSAVPEPSGMLLVLMGIAGEAVRAVRGVRLGALSDGVER